MNIEITGPLSTIVNIFKYQFDLKKIMCVFLIFRSSFVDSLDMNSHSRDSVFDALYLMTLQDNIMYLKDMEKCFITSYSRSLNIAK